MYVLINMPEWKYKSIVEGVAAGKRCNCPNEMVPAASIIADGIAIPNVPGDILIVSMTCKGKGWHPTPDATGLRTDYHPAPPCGAG